MTAIEADENSRDRLPRLCLMGTSNGIFKDGYASVFSRTDAFARFDNYSVGFCSSDMLAYQKKELLLKSTTSV